MRNWEGLSKLEVLREARLFAASIGALDAEGRPPEITRENAVKMGVAEIDDPCVHSREGVASAFLRRRTASLGLRMRFGRHGSSLRGPMWMQTSMQGGGHAMASFSMSAGATEPSPPPLRARRAAGAREDAAAQGGAVVQVGRLRARQHRRSAGDLGAAVRAQETQGCETVVVLAPGGFEAAGWQQAAQAC
ncbi:unnamed protein product, partial [Prorocentrum cordatum]